MALQIQSQESSKDDDIELHAISAAATTAMDPDPWNWDPAAVQQYFSRDAIAYMKRRPGTQTPPAAFIQALGDKEVDGASLLDMMTQRTLLEEFGLNSFRQRGAVMYCVESLQRKSRRFQTRFNSPSPETPRSLPATPVAPPLDLEPTVEGVGENVRAGEQQTEDERGRKRRKLDLTNSQPQSMLQSAPNIDVAAFLPDAGMPIDELFFGKTPFGREVQELNPNGKDVFEDQDAEKAEYTFSFGRQPSSRGQAEYALKRIRHFLHNEIETVDVRRHKREALAVMPYPDKLALRARSALVIQSRDESAEGYISVRERASLAQAPLADESPLYQEDVDAYDEDVLKRWRHTLNDRIVGDSDDEESDPGSDDRAASESEAEEVDDYGVSRSRVAEIIEAEIASIVAEWQERKMPELEKTKAWSVWKEMKQSRALRDNKIEEARARVRHLDKRLRVQRQAYEADEWNSGDALRQVCKNLHATVEDRELLKWKISVWHRKKEPAHTIMHRGPRLSRHEHTSTDAARSHDTFAVHPDDRMSVEPTTPNHVHTTETPFQAEDGDDEMDDHGSEDEQEVFRTPGGTPSPDEFIVSDGLMSVDEAGQSRPPTSDDEAVRGQGEVSAALTSSPPPTDFVNSEQGQEGCGEGTQALRQFVDHMSSDIESPSDAGLSPLKSFMNPKPPQGTPAAPATPSRSSRHGRLSTQPITISSSEAEPTDRASSPEPDLGKKKKAKAKSKAVSGQTASIKARNRSTTAFNSEPDRATGDDVDSWDLKELRQLNDRQRVLIKLLKDAGPEKRQSLHLTLLAINLPDRVKVLQSAIQTILVDDLSDLSQPTVSDDMIWCVRLAMAWYLPGEFQEAALPWSELKQNEEDLRVFIVSLNKFLAQKHGKLFQNTPRSSIRNPVAISSDEEEDQEPKDTPHKKRKRDVKQSHSALMARSRARARHDQFTQQVDSQEAISSQIEARAASGASHSSFRINPYYKKSDDDDGIAPPPIYINRKIAKQMKPHQVEGVRFMWREVTAAGEEGGQGCLLAHTMGLGKTMQSIALLAAIVQASESPDREIRMQLPPNLRPREVGSEKNKRQLRLMILCPPGLIPNWRHEISLWAGNALGNVFAVEAPQGEKAKKQQRQDLEDWYRVGGVLIVGNETFRNFFKAKKGEEESSAEIERLARNEEVLLKGPEVVVADEVHKYKSTTTAISKAVNRIATHTRIGLTGTPMSNDVSEIYSLVNWAAPDFLGDPVEFKAKFQEPIENGMYFDSTSYEIRKSIKKLKVLQHEIQPKVHRADITVLKGSLKPKTEFVIIIPLTEVQTEAYKRYLDALLGGGKNEKASQVAIFGWLAVLMLLTNHPSAFMQKLLAPPAPKKKGKGRKSADKEGFLSGGNSPGNAAVSREVAMEQGLDPEAFEAPGDEDVRTLGFSEEQIKAIIGDMEDTLDPALSAKVSILMEILRLSQDCGDQVLLFSHSIPTLNYLGRLFVEKDIKYGRLDGQVNMKDRLPLIDSFNAKKLNVLLLSTRAAGTGLNIQGANRVVIFDFSFNPSWELQAVGRAYRFGQQKPVFVYRFVAGGTFETNLYNKQMFKTGLASRVVDKKNTRRNAQRNTRDYLYPPRPVAQENLSQWIGKDPKVLDKLLQMHDPSQPGGDFLMRSIQTMEVLQQEGEDAPLDEQEQREVDEEIQAGKITGRGAVGGSRRKTADALSGVPASTAPMMPPPTNGTPSLLTRLPVATNNIGQPFGRPPSTAPQPARSGTGPNANMPNGLPIISPSSSLNQSGRPRGH